MDQARPDLTVPPDAWPQTIQLVKIALSRSDWIDFVVKKPHPIAGENKKFVIIQKFRIGQHVMLCGRSMIRKPVAQKFFLG